MKKRLNETFEILGGKIMNKTELVAAVAQKAELSKKDAKRQLQL